jgi:2-C-methyl-D-erythritol 4-phosphate cytidylyltransferase
MPSNFCHSVHNVGGQVFKEIQAAIFVVDAARGFLRMRVISLCVMG